MTLLRTFIRSGKLKRWLADPNCPSLIQECKAIFDKAYSVYADDEDKADMDNEDDDLKEVFTPPDLQHLLKSPKVILSARHRHNGIMYARSSTHVGNSLIYFYPDGDRNSPAVHGSIKYIVKSKSTSFRFAVQRQLPLPSGVTDPFAPYPHFPAMLCSSQLQSALEVVKVDWVITHYARWEMSQMLAVVLTLYRVCFLFDAVYDY